MGLLSIIANGFVRSVSEANESYSNTVERAEEMSDEQLRRKVENIKRNGVNPYGAKYGEARAYVEEYKKRNL